MRLPDKYDLDLRKAVQGESQEAAPLPPADQKLAHASSGTGTSQAAASIANASVSNASDKSTNSMKASATEGRSQRKRQLSKRDAEASLIDSLRHMGEKGEDAVACVTACRYGDAARHEWSTCLDRCVANPLMRSTFRSLLPEENHVAHSTDVVVPEILKQRLERKRQRSAEL